MAGHRRDLEDHRKYAETGLLCQDSWNRCRYPHGETTGGGMEDFAEDDDQRGKVMPARRALYPYFAQDSSCTVKDDLGSNDVRGLHTRGLSPDQSMTQINQFQLVTARARLR